MDKIPRYLWSGLSNRTKPSVRLRNHRSELTQSTVFLSSTFSLILKWHVASYKIHNCSQSAVWKIIACVFSIFFRGYVVTCNLFPFVMYQERQFYFICSVNLFESNTACTALNWISGRKIVTSSKFERRRRRKSWLDQRGQKYFIKIALYSSLLSLGFNTVSQNPNKKTFFNAIYFSSRMSTLLCRIHSSSVNSMLVAVFLWEA